MSEMEISPFPTPAAGWLALRLNTADCYISRRSQNVGYLFFLLSVLSIVPII